MNTRNFMNEFWTAARQGPRLYFAPLMGAVQAVKDELSVQSTGRVSVKNSVEVSVTPARKRKR
jgi:hypothetical protein